MKYDMFHSRNGLQENILTTNYGFNTELGSNRFGMDFELKNLFYRKNNLPAINFWDYYAVFTMNPYYLIQRDDWFLRAGLKTTFSFIHGRPFNPMPDISAEWKVLPAYVSLYGGISGSYTISTLNDIYAENPYVYADLRIKDQYTPIRSYFGIKVKAIHNLLIDAFIDYSYINDQYFFVNKEYKTNDPGVRADTATIFTNRFNVIYSDAGLFRTGVRIGYNIRNLVNVQLKGVYNGWSVQSERFAWMKPAYEVDFSADLRVNKKITASLNVFYEGAKYARMGVNSSGIVIARRMNPVTDINLGAAYSFSKTLSTFVKINNLLNNQYEHYYGYKVQGLNFLVGGTMGF
jgi:hypothetical protein